MNFDLIFAIIFYAAIFLFYLKHKERFTNQGLLILYKTQLGIRLMNKLSRKFPKTLRFLSNISIFVGFLGMIFILYTLIQGTYKLILGYLGILDNVQPVLAPVLPGVSIQGLPVLSFWHWIIGIFIVAVVHEFAHGVYARLYKLDVKSSGFAFLGPILAAFVEPDEKQLKKIETKKQLAIISAGPFVNIVLAFLVILFFSFVFAPLQNNVFFVDGVNLVQVEPGSPANLSGMYPGLLIKEINNVKIDSQEKLVNEIKNSDENDILKLSTDKGNYYLRPVIVEGIPKLGISVGNHLAVKEGLPKFLLPFFTWFNMLFFWLWVINLGIGLFNLLPLGPIDGGRMLYMFLLSKLSNKKALKIFKFVSAFCLFLIFVNLVPWLIKLFTWIFNLFS